MAPAEPSTTARPDGTRLRRYVSAWVVAAVVTAAAASLVGWHHPRPAVVWVVAILLVTVLVGKLGQYVPVYGVRGHASLHEVGGVLAILLLSPPWAVAVAAAAELIYGATSLRGDWTKTAFNTASRSSGVAVGAVSFHLVAGPRFTPSAVDLVAAMLAAALLVAVNAGAFTGLLTVLSGTSWATAVREELPSAPLDYGIAMTGLLAAVLVVAAPAALPLLAVPTLLDQVRVRSQKEHYELTAAKAQAEQANRAKSEFLSRMSHELRTPLNAILGFGQLLEMDAGLDEDVRISSGLIVRSGRHLLAMIDEVLDISRIEAGRLAFDLETVAVERVIEESVELVRPLADQRGIHLRTEPGAHVPHVTADHQRLRQVLINLLSNAVKYNREGGRATVTVRAQPEDGTVELAVVDTGHGISATDQERLFVPFERLGARDGEIEGIGLGLALSKNLVEAMDGELRVSSVVGHGSTFAVVLPVAPAFEHTVVASAEPSPPADDAAPGPAARVVYIEDNPSNVELVRRVLLRRPGVVLTTAPDATVGLALVREQLPDLVLLDLQLPGIHGDAVLRRIRDDAELANTPVAVLSADASPRRIEELLAAGAVAYLTKPLDVGELLALIDRAVDRSLEGAALATSGAGAR